MPLLRAEAEKLSQNQVVQGIIEEIIVPRDTRKRVAVLLDALKDKSDVRLPKKHNNIPL